MVLPVLLLILFAIMEYGWLMVHQIVLINAVSTGARAAIRANPEELAPYTAKDYTVKAFWIGTLTRDQVLAEMPADDPKRVYVSVPAWDYEPITQFLPSALLPKSLNAASVMVFP